MEIDAGGRSVTLRPASIGEIISLRDEMLIRGTERHAPEFEGDDAPDTLHLGAFAGDTIVGCVSFMMSTFEGRPAWQLRGMATAACWQGRGIGRALLAYSEACLADAGEVAAMWCNARTAASGFYRQAGWRPSGEVFEIDGVGPHVRMSKSLRGNRPQ